MTDCSAIVFVNFRSFNKLIVIRDLLVSTENLTYISKVKRYKILTTKYRRLDFDEYLFRIGRMEAELLYLELLTLTFFFFVVKLFSLHNFN